MKPSTLGYKFGLAITLLIAACGGSLVISYFVIGGDNDGYAGLYLIFVLGFFGILVGLSFAVLSALKSGSKASSIAAPIFFTVLINILQNIANQLFNTAKEESWSYPDIIATILIILVWVIFIREYISNRRLSNHG